MNETSHLKHPPLVDLHCHLLPAVDDGAADGDEALGMARLATTDGLSSVVATVHQTGGKGPIHADEIRRRVERLRAVLQRQEVPLQVYPGAEVCVEADIPARIRRGDVMTLADRGRHVLLELPADSYIPLEGLLSRLRGMGVVGILAHPERNQGILRDPAVLNELADCGCLFQITAGALLGGFGPRVQNLARRMTAGRLVHFVASDAHGAKSRRPLLHVAFDWVTSAAGHQFSVDLFCRNPAKVIAGEHVDQRSGKTKQFGFIRRFRGRKAG
ncbi:MAG: CpsB/CapC family capsule biosynthesis tyrosine phosphatase [Thermoguttaceae bacterium]